MPIPQFQNEKTFRVTPFFNILTNLVWQNGGIKMSYVRTQSQNYITNQSQLNYFNLEFRQEVTEKIILTINPYFNTITSQGDRINYNQYYYGITPRITYKLTEKVSIGANYNLGYRKNTGSINYAFPINDVYVFLNCSYPVHFQR